MLIALHAGQIGHLVVKLRTNANGTTYNCPNLEPIQVAFYLAGEITQVIDSIPWVRCASGNVWKICGKCSDFRNIFKSLQNFEIFRKIIDFQELSRFSGILQIIGKLSRFLGIFQIFGKFSQVPMIVTFVTLITILTIKNRIHDNFCYLTINCDTGQHC